MPKAKQSDLKLFTYCGHRHIGYKDDAYLIFSPDGETADRLFLIEVRADRGPLFPLGATLKDSYFKIVRREYRVEPGVCILAASTVEINLDQPINDR